MTRGFLHVCHVGWLANGCKRQAAPASDVCLNGIIFVLLETITNAKDGRISAQTDCRYTRAQQSMPVSELRHLQAPLCTWPPLSHKRINGSRKKVSKKNSNKKIRLAKTFQKAHVYQ